MLGSVNAMHHHDGCVEAAWRDFPALILRTNVQYTSFLW